MLLTLGVYLAFIALLFVAALSDIRKREVPNWLVCAIVLIWLVWRMVLFLGSPETLQASAFDLIAALAVGAIALAFATIYERATGKYSMGGADIKLIAASTLFLGLEHICIAVMLACLVSLVYAAFRIRNIPFASGIACGVLVVVLFV